MIINPEKAKGGATASTFLPPCGRPCSGLWIISLYLFKNKNNQI